MRKNPHVRIRGGLGSVTALVYPTTLQRQHQCPTEGRGRPTGSARFIHGNALPRCDNRPV